MAAEADVPRLLGPRACGLEGPGDPDRACSYLPGERALLEAYLAPALGAAAYERLLDSNFRRAGFTVYRPICRACRRCRQVRVLVEAFRPSRSQRRCLKRNQDLTVRVGRPCLDAGKAELYRRYLHSRHPGGEQDDRPEALEQFLYRSPLPALEAEFRDRAGRLVGVSIVDLLPASLSSVYHFFEPAESRRGLGTFSVLAEIELARALGKRHYYLGYLIEGLPAMEYKVRFRPHEVLEPAGWTGSGTRPAPARS